MDTFPEATVLVVDDTPENLAAVGCFLEGLCSTAAALTGDEALELAMKLQPDVILLDVLMPGISGLDVLKELKSNPVTKSIAVLLVTSLSDPESKLEGFACGAVDFVSKPFLAGELRARVATQLRIRQLEHELRQQIRSLNQEISDGRQNFDFFAQHTTSCLLCIDAWDRVVLINPAWKHLTAKDPDAALGQLFFHLFIEKDRDFVREKIRQALAARQTHVHFFARIAGLAQSRTVFVSASFPRTPSAGTHRWCAALTDVSLLADEKEKWKTACEQFHGHYAACWEELQKTCSPLESQLPIVETAMANKANLQARADANEMQEAFGPLNELLVTNRKILQFIGKNKIPSISVPSESASKATSFPVRTDVEGSLTCLVIETSPVQGRLFSILLSDCGVSSIRIAPSLAEACREIRETPPDILLFDLSLGSDGDDPHPARLLRDIGKTSATVIGISAPGFASPAPELQKMCARILYRPLSLSALREAMSDCGVLRATRAIIR